MIIGLSGYAGSGKDTVAIITQWLLSHGSKTSTLKDVLDNYSSNAWWLEKHSGWQLRSYAAKLKQVAGILLGWQPGVFDRQEVKASNLGKEWDEMSVRTFLQRLGTDGLRNGLHQDVWTNALWADYYGQNWIVTDVRFVNEAERIKEKGGVMVRVKRQDVAAVNHHISETALDHWQFDHTINNNESVEALVLSVINMLNTFKIDHGNQETEN